NEHHLRCNQAPRHYRKGTHAERKRTNALLRSRREGQQAADPGSRRAAFQGESAARAHDGCSRKRAPPRQVQRLPGGLEESVRHAARRRKDDRVRGECLMAIKTFRPKTHSLRFKTVIDYKQDLTTDEPFKPLLEPKNRINGRNSYGRMTVNHRGGGNKKHYRIIDFRRNKTGIPAKVETIEYDPNRSAFIALLSYADGERRYILQPVAFNVGMAVVTGPAG